MKKLCCFPCSELPNVSINIRCPSVCCQLREEQRRNSTKQERKKTKEEEEKKKKPEKDHERQ